MSNLTRIFIFVLLAVSCGQDASFYAESPKAKSVTPTTGEVTKKTEPVLPVAIESIPIIHSIPTPTPIPALEPIVIPPTPSPSLTPIPCTELPKTHAVLKTASVNQTKKKRFINYEISIVDCNGDPMAFQSDYLMYDFDAYHQETGNMTGIIKFKITNPVDSEVISGDMIKVKGSDLFNRVGSQWEHYKTEQIIAFKNPTKLFQLEIDMSQVWIVSPIKSSSYTPEGYMLIATFLKFGNTVPVEGDVIFK